MDIPLTQQDVLDIINYMSHDAEIKIYLLDKDNKQSMYNMIEKNTQRPSNHTSRQFFLIYYDLDTIGHWATMVIDYQEFVACFYCSYGLFIDEQYDYKNTDDSNHELVRNILHYLFNLGFDVHYNDIQKQNLNTNLCGRYCALYMLFNIDDTVPMVTPDIFNELLDRKATYNELDIDDYVLYITTN